MVLSVKDHRQMSMTLGECEREIYEHEKQEHQMLELISSKGGKRNRHRPRSETEQNDRNSRIQR